MTASTGAIDANANPARLTFNGEIRLRFEPPQFLVASATYRALLVLSAIQLEFLGHKKRRLTPPFSANPK